jgi:hypothetical protein
MQINHLKEEESVEEFIAATNGKPLWLYRLFCVEQGKLKTRNHNMHK